MLLVPQACAVKHEVMHPLHGGKESEVRTHPCHRPKHQPSPLNPQVNQYDSEFSPAPVNPNTKLRLPNPAPYWPYRTRYQSGTHGPRL